jgi:pyruvate/2-oxoglutarate dehydrogenase complex dihydrolipoamide acyltransferase (E2) component
MRVAAIIMPQFGETAGEEIKIVKWKKSIGDAVKAGDALLEVDTEKSTLDVEAADTGRLTAILKNAGDIAHAGDIIGYLED